MLSQGPQSPSTPSRASPPQALSFLRKLITIYFAVLEGATTTSPETSE